VLVLRDAPSAAQVVPKVVETVHVANRSPHLHATSILLPLPLRLHKLSHDVTVPGTQLCNLAAHNALKTGQQLARLHTTQQLA
jgi:hypothetical protein